ncbi:MAG TPA: hypothetical protein VER96_15095 [Polyangiaceae bacterium]|nr:hypothetical protein [Polyangiaceae bacterium]
MADQNWSAQLVRLRAAAGQYSDSTLRATLAAQGSAIGAALATLRGSSGNPNFSLAQSTRVNAAIARLTRPAITKISACAAALALCEADLSAAPINAFLAVVPNLLALPSFSGGTLAAAQTAAAPIIAALGPLGGAVRAQTRASALVSAVQVAAASTLASLSAALKPPVDVALSLAAQALPPTATPAQKLTAALIEALDPASFTTAATDTTSLIAAGVGTPGIRLALDQAASSTPDVRSLYISAELSSASYRTTFAVRGGDS